MQPSRRLKATEYIYKYQAIDIFIDTVSIIIPREISQQYFKNKRMAHCQHARQAFNRDTARHTPRGRTLAINIMRRLSY